MALYEMVTSLNRTQKRLIFLVVDGLTVRFALVLAAALSASITLDWNIARTFAPLTAILLGIAFLSSQLLGLTRIKLNAYEFQGILRTTIFAGILGMSGLILNVAFGNPLSNQTFLIFTMLLLIMSVSTRMFLRQTLIRIYRTGSDRMRVLVYGAGQTGQQLAAALRTDDAVQPIAFVDDNPTLHSLVVSGLPVHAPSKIRELIDKHAIDRVVLAMPSASHARQAQIAHRLRQFEVEVHSLPSFATLVSEGELGQRLTPVPINDLLGRSRLESQLPTVSETYAGRRVLITGAGGSIGSELCRQVMSCKPDVLVILDHSELALYSILKELLSTKSAKNNSDTRAAWRNLARDVRIVPVLGSVCDRALVEHVLKEHEIQVVLHAAAYKHLPLVETNEISGLENNVFGTKTMADASRSVGVERFILVSSDKAVRPTNVMGASKRLAELVVQDLSSRSDSTLFSMVRFGNVLGSSGSVVPLFEEQIARGGPVTLTHGEVTRYFMTISEAARLVLLAGSLSRGGDLFVLDMGEPVPIRKLARQMIEGAGLTVLDESNPQGDIEIVEIGLRPGEKLHEELLISPDMLTTPHQKIMRAQEGFLSEIEMANALKDLRNAIEARDPLAARAVISRWVERRSEKNPLERRQIS